MEGTPPLQPTLWRTCRALANLTRLRMLQLLIQEPGQTVSAVATRLKQPMSLTSEYLRTLEARGLLTVCRMGPEVEYRPNTEIRGGPAQALGAVLRSAFQNHDPAVGSLFKLATAFTHPRRIEIYRALRGRALGPAQIKAATGISMRALGRHLEKLEARGFIKCKAGIYSWANPEGAFGRELGRLAGE